MEALSYKYFVIVTYGKQRKHRVIVTTFVAMALGKTRLFGEEPS